MNEVAFQSQIEHSFLCALPNLCTSASLRHTCDIWTCLDQEEQFIVSPHTGIKPSYSFARCRFWPPSKAAICLSKADGRLASTAVADRCRPSQLKQQSDEASSGTPMTRNLNVQQTSLCCTAQFTHPFHLCVEHEQGESIFTAPDNK